MRGSYFPPLREFVFFLKVKLDASIFFFVSGAGRKDSPGIQKVQEGMTMSGNASNKVKMNYFF